MHTVRELLNIMNLSEYSHVVVKYREPGFGLVGLGGGSPGYVLSRFGDHEIDWTNLVDNILVIVVKVN